MHLFLHISLFVTTKMVIVLRIANDKHSSSKLNKQNFYGIPMRENQLIFPSIRWRYLSQ